MLSRFLHLAAFAAHNDAQHDAASLIAKLDPPPPPTDDLTAAFLRAVRIRTRHLRKYLSGTEPRH